MVVPKRKMSRSNTAPSGKPPPAPLVAVTVGGRQLLVPRKLVRAYQRRLLSP